MNDYDNTDRFALFKNERKQQESHADYTGTLNVGGVDYFINAWSPKPGSKLVLSGSIKKKDVQVQPSGSGPGQYTQPEEFSTENPPF